MGRSDKDWPGYEFSRETAIKFEFPFWFSNSILRNNPKTKVSWTWACLWTCSLQHFWLCVKKQPDTIKINRAMIFVRLRIWWNTSQKSFSVSIFRRPYDRNCLSGNKEGMKMTSRRSFGNKNGTNIMLQSWVMNFLMWEKQRFDTLFHSTFHSTSSTDSHTRRYSLKN